MLPICCPAEAYSALEKAMPAMESDDGLVLALSAVENLYSQKAEADSVDGLIQKIVDTVRSRCRSGHLPALLAHLDQLLFDDMLLKPCADRYTQGITYVQLRLSSLLSDHAPILTTKTQPKPRTISSRLLSVVYLIVLHRLGIKARAVIPVDHTDTTFITCDDAGGAFVLDPSTGTRVDLENEAMFVENWRLVITILQQALRAAGNAGAYELCAAALEMEMIICPKHIQLQRDLGLCLARVGMSKPAHRFLESYLADAGEDPQRQELEQLIQVLKA
jgi:hypothetical protein